MPRQHYSGDGHSAGWENGPRRQHFEPRRRNPDRRAIADQSAIIRILPDGEPGARRAPRFHHFLVAALTACQPLRKIRDQVFHYRVGHTFILGGLLLRHAVQRSQAPDQIHAVDADHLAVRETFARACSSAMRSFGSLNVGTSTDLVGDVEIRVAGREALAIEIRAARAWAVCARATGKRLQDFASSRAGARSSRSVAIVFRRRSRRFRDR